MLNMFSSLLATVGGLIVFAGAWYIHQKVRLTRTACVMAAVGGFVTYSGVVGSWANQYARQLGIVCAVAVFVGVCIIVADIKGKKKGADRPALIAFFLVPIFLASGIGVLPTITKGLRDGVQKNTTQMQKMG
ncbi:hypothetical protein ACWT_5829 [Actinoplanes sp. SE50]|uniref:hypothetical protein n=1 Tax=unclassified Actinoplanes TaxID=2626549 RepID=UPI00023EBC20|nr:MULTISPECIES: hypothetical protein [unclassified Actinoplanes]AEV86847.1 hypothetical protein ACPL_5960 [Actinoplanes sp. SE50/110]ATO85244.1 hypothetical protein ACWT_5829 [Actinoplanes sp. SE50]SLM02654.1 hypothetical protein ACSP50_5936 [Actinoplanes sp. SE50/110]